MTINQKIEKIELLSIESLQNLVEKLLIKMSYIEISTGDLFTKGSLKGPMKNDLHGFIYLSEQLSGNVDLNSIIKKITDITNNYKFNTVFITSSFHISKGFENSLISTVPSINFSFLGRDQLIEYVDQFFNDFWKHDDVNLLDYEKDYCNSLLKDSELKTLKIFSDKYQKLLDIFIEPKIHHFYEEKETKTPIRKSVNIENIIKEKKPLLLTGEAGAGKSTLLKRIGETIINKNQDNTRKCLPVFISVTDIYEANYNLSHLLNNKTNNYFKGDLETILKDYDIVLLVDSIDEFESSNQKIIIKQLDNLFTQLDIKFILGTRSTEKSVSFEQLKNYNTFTIARFSNQQIEQFVKKFFFNENSRAEKLLEALKENRIIEKLPITPLSLSLISILYEENDLEIPATITDIYDNFNSLLLGKAIVSSRIEFIDISFKERILSLYALELLKRKEHKPMTMDEFIQYFTEYYKSKTIPLKKGTLQEVLDYLVESTGVIYLKNATYVAFNHDSFMEYYAALEIFKHQRVEEKSYVSNFFDLNWQNSAVFYAGNSKDMSDFLKQINQKLSSSKNINEYFSAISGAGYLLQALYQTDNNLRKETINIALEINIRALEVFLKLSSDDAVLFKSFKLPIIWLMNLVFFYENFNSGTLKEPLKLSFNEILNNYSLNQTATSEGYKALTIALTLNSNRINEGNEIEELIFKSHLLEDNILTIIADIAIKVMYKGNLLDVKKEIKKEYKKMATQTKYLLETPASKLRFSPYDKISTNKKIKIVTEGITDAEILEHSFITLTKGDQPYWSIRPTGNNSGGGAREVNKTLMTAYSLIQDDETIIGIFDHDEEGIKEFNMLAKDVFPSFKNGIVKKHANANIFAILLPITEDKIFFLHKDQKYNFFEIEHYLPYEFLSKFDSVRQTPIEGLYTIIDTKKNTLSKEIRKSTDINLFHDFMILLELIDEICGVHIEYL